MTPDDVYEFIVKRGGECTFAEFVQHMKGARGSMELYVPNTNKMVVVWTGLSMDLVKCIEKLRNDGKIIFERVKPQVYSKVMKLSLDLPISDGRPEAYLTHHWFPCLVKITRVEKKNGPEKV